MRATVTTPSSRQVRHSTLLRIVILGAARSGTKMLRDALAAATGAGVVPYDIGYVWRSGNEARDDDVLESGAIGAAGRRFILKFIDKYAAGDPPAVIEKTVGNTLRVPAVAETLPEARYIHLLRDGVDVIESTRRQWKAPTDLRYVLRKAPHFPLRLAPRYGVKYVRSLLSRHHYADGRVGTWGPRYPGMDSDLRQHSLLTVCSRQWRWSVTSARADLARLGLPVADVRYDHLVRDPAAELTRLADFAGLSYTKSKLAAAADKISGSRQGAGRRALSEEDRACIAAEVGDLLNDLGYPNAFERRGPDDS